MSARNVIFFFLACLAIAGACPAAQPTGASIDVPFVAQTKDGCGSAAISMVVQYWENRGGQADPDIANPERIQKALYSPSMGGIPASSMREYFRSSGFRAFAFHGDWGDLMRHIDKGRPLIVSLKASGALEPLHYVVVVGIDRDRNYVYLNDPAQQKMLRMSREGFESEWNPTHNWTLLAVPQPGE